MSSGSNDNDTWSGWSYSMAAKTSAVAADLAVTIGSKAVTIGSKAAEKASDIKNKLNDEAYMNNLKKNTETWAAFHTSTTNAISSWWNTPKTDDISEEAQEAMDEALSQLAQSHMEGTNKLKREINAIMTRSIMDMTDIDEKNMIDIDAEPVINCIYENKVGSESITCEHMKCPPYHIMCSCANLGALKCPTYRAMIEKNEFFQENLRHLRRFSHFKHEYEEKPECKDKDECISFIRSKSGPYQTADECHMALFRHPPRNRNIKLSQNINKLIRNPSKSDNMPLYKPTDIDKQTYFDKKCGFLAALIEEVMVNGYKYDLCLKCKQNDDCQHNYDTLQDITKSRSYFTYTQHSIFGIVERKMDHDRHIAMNKPLRIDHMLALILYTGCDCNYDLCKTQRNGDYTKWKWFDYLLHSAIKRLSRREKGRFPVYTGLSNINLEVKELKFGYFKTYVSTSCNEDIARSFMGNKGMIIKFDKSFISSSWNFSCDLRWISKFPDEGEILFSRSIPFSTANELQGFNCTVLDQSNAIQTVKLSLKWGKSGLPMFGDENY